MTAPDEVSVAGAQQATRLALLPLTIALLITLAVTLDPRLLTDARGGAEHGAASLMFWSMSAGYVRGVGFVPRHPAIRVLLSTPACLLALAAAGLRLFA